MLEWFCNGVLLAGFLLVRVKMSHVQVILCYSDVVQILGLGVCSILGTANKCNYSAAVKHNFMLI